MRRHLLILLLVCTTALQARDDVYDAIVAADGSGDYTSLQAAIDALPDDSPMQKLIFVKAGTYEEHVYIAPSKSRLSIVGEGRDRVVITDRQVSGGPKAVPVDRGATVVVHASDVTFQGISFVNGYGVEAVDGPQALALYAKGDRIALNGVRLLSYQDTWITTSTSNNRHYIKNSLIEGAVDFIYNSGNVYLDGDTLEINRPSGGFIVAPSHGADVKWGYVFMNNVLRPIKGMNVTDVWLGRPWHNSPKTVFINLQTFINIPAAGWYETMGGLPALWADYNTVDAEGNPVDLSQRRDTYYYTDDDGNRVYGKAKNYLTAEEAAEYTLKNVCSGDDNWQPDLMCEACEAPVTTVLDGKISWEAVPYAICYVVTCGDEVVGFTTDTEFATEAGADYKVQAVNEFGGLSKFSTKDTAVGITTLKQQATATQTVFTPDGKRAGQSTRGLVIIRHEDGTVSKSVK